VSSKYFTEGGTSVVASQQSVTVLRNTFRNFNSVKNIASSLGYVGYALSSRGLIVEMIGYAGYLELGANTFSNIIDKFGVISGGTNLLCDSVMASTATGPTVPSASMVVS
jgi:hypothetical protein